MSETPRDLTVIRARLERIARSLGQPVSAFFDDQGMPTRDAETLVLLRAFDLILDRQTRDRCIAFVNAEAARETMG